MKEALDNASDGEAPGPPPASVPSRSRLFWSLFLAVSLLLSALAAFILGPSPSLSERSPAPRSQTIAEGTDAPSALDLLPGEYAPRFLSYLQPFDPTRMAPVQVPLRPGAASRPSDLVYDGIDYDDPTGADAPLQWVRGREEEQLSPNFRLSDFAPRDGSPMVRADPTLIDGLERIREKAGKLAIVSGYRHMAYNTTVGGVANSYHTAGQAADIWVPEHSPIALARFALITMGCDIGLGLGVRTLHIDIRGELTTWTYGGAAMSESAFDAWALTQCGRPVPAWLAAAAAEAWLEETPAAAELAQRDSALAPAESMLDPEALLQRYATPIATLIQRQGTRGAVILDLREDAEARVRYAAPASPEVDALGLAPLVSWSAARGDGAYIAYAIYTEAEDTHTGITNISGTNGLRLNP